MLVSAHKSTMVDELWLSEDGSLPLTCVSWPDFAKAAGLPRAIRNLPD